MLMKVCYNSSMKWEMFTGKHGLCGKIKCFYVGDILEKM